MIFNLNLNCNYLLKTDFRCFYYYLLFFISLSNALVEYMLNGTAIKEALQNGKNLDGDTCEKIYSFCPLTKEQSLQIFSKLLPTTA